MRHNIFGLPAQAGMLDFVPANEPVCSNFNDQRIGGADDQTRLNEAGKAFCDIINTEGIRTGEINSPCNGLPDHDPERGQIRTLYVEDPLKCAARQKRQRRSKHDVAWFDKRVIEGHKVSKRVISPEDRSNAIAAAAFMMDRGTPFNVHIALKPPTDHLTPVERMRVWPTYRQMFRVTCRNLGITCSMLAVRESDPVTHNGEHEHWLVYVPSCLREKVIGLVKGWCDNAFAEAVRSTGRTICGRAKSIVSYLLKAASPRSVAQDDTITYRQSGAVLGNRVFISRNIDGKARGAAEIEVRAARRIRNERLQISRLKRIADQPIREPVAHDDIPAEASFDRENGLRALMLADRDSATTELFGTQTRRTLDQGETKNNSKWDAPEGFSLTDQIPIVALAYEIPIWKIAD